MRRLLVGLMIVALVGTSAEAFRGRFGRGAHSQQNQPATNPEPPPQNFIENLTVQTIATDGYCNRGSIEYQAEPSFGTDHSVYFAYLTNREGCATGSRWNRVLKYDYTTGLWTQSDELISGNPAGSDGHETGAVFTNANGIIFLALGGVTASQTSPFTGPFYYRASSANSISAWGSITRLPVLGSFASHQGGFQGAVGLICGSIQGGQTGHAVFDWWCARTEDNGDTWEEGLLVGDETGAVGGTPQGSTGDPSACTRAIHIEPAPSTTIHILWGGTTSGCGSNTIGGWYAKSTDGGATWTSVAGTQSVSWPNGITPVSHDGTIWQWHSDYRVFTDSGGANNPQIRLLSNGRPIAARGVIGATKAWVYSGSGTTWNSSTVATGISGCGMTMEVSETGRVYVWTTDCQDIWQITSDDNGSTWSSATKVYDSSLVNFKLRSKARASVGGKNRARLTWLQDPGAESSIRSNILTLDVVMQ